MRCIAPAAMTPAERLAELVEILATGVQRYFAHECKVQKGSRNSHARLDAPGPAEAQCANDAVNPKSTEPGP